jgi:hypothetical protein
MNVYIVDKRTRAKKVIEENLTEEQAWSFCEAWGWNYIDENGKSFWLEIDD